MTQIYVAQVYELYEYALLYNTRTQILNKTIAPPVGGARETIIITHACTFTSVHKRPYVYACA